MKESNRQSNYDLLRIFATIAVIIIHANFRFFGNRYQNPDLSLEYCVESLLNIITRFSVPVFVMLSGGFNLNNEKNADAKFFYQKVTWKIGVPFLFISFILLIYEVAYVLVNGLGTKAMVLRALGLLSGNYALWYIYMLAGLYLMTPLIIKLKKALTSKEYISLSVVLMVWGTVSQALSDYLIPYTLGTVVAFLGYYLMGDLLINHYNRKHSSFLYSVVALVMFGISWLVRYKGFIFYTSSTTKNFFSPTIIIASMCVLLVFKSIKTSINVSYLSRLTFYIYLFHALILNVFYEQVIAQYAGQINELLATLIMTAFTFVVAFLAAAAFDAVWRKQDGLKKKWYSLRVWNWFDS